MSTTETFKGNSYEIVAWARGQEPLLFEQFGSYQGEWLLLSYKDGEYQIYKDYYGSCSGCDSWEAWDGHDMRDDDYNLIPPTREKAMEFAKDYKSFIEIPAATAAKLAKNGTFIKVLPANIRDSYGMEDANIDAWAKDAELIIKLKEGLKITKDDILSCRNQEVKQKALKQFGYEQFVEETGSKELDRTGEDALIDVGGVIFLSVKDSSTDRRYLLRVPDNMKRVRQAKAWTFNVSEAEYAPLIET
jgi:hypothetical protein